MEERIDARLLLLYSHMTDIAKFSDDRRKDRCTPALALLTIDIVVAHG
jgi:hypothetical protein